MDPTNTDIDTLCEEAENLDLLNWQDFTRSPLEDEPLRINKRVVRYCAFDGCDYSSHVLTNFRGHLLKKHQIQTTTTTPSARRLGAQQLEEIWQQAEARTKQEIQTVAFEQYLDKKVVQQCLVRLVVQERLALSFVEAPSFHAFCQSLNPLVDSNILPTSHSTIRTAIQSHWYEEKLILQREIQTALSKIHISLDIWTSPNRLLFIAILGHFVRQSDGTRRKNLLALRQVAGHSGDEQFTVLRTVLEEYEISQDLGVITGDNATTNDTLCRTISKWQSTTFKLKWEPDSQRIRCLGHILNLIAQAFLFAGSSEHCPEEVLQSIDLEEADGAEVDVVRRNTVRTIGPMGKLHNIVVFIRGSGIRTKEFVSQAHRMIPLDNRTRWNSWYYMISTAIDLEMHVDFFVKNQPDLKQDSLDSEDWEILRTIKSFLKIFKDLTLESEGNSKNLANALPSLWLLQRHITAFVEKHKQGTSNFDFDCLVRGETALSTLNKWWNLLWKHPTYQMATILHPFYRTNWLDTIMQILRISAKEQKAKKESLKKIWLEYLAKHQKLSCNDQPSTGQAKEKGQQKEHGKGETRKRRTTAQITKELEDRSVEAMTERMFGGWASAEAPDEWESYLLGASSKNVKNLLSWWQDDVRRAEFPVLHLLALEIHSIPPMSDEPERVFSGGRRTVSWERSSLNAETIEVIECLHHWLNERYKS